MTRYITWNSAYREQFPSPLSFKVTHEWNYNSVFILIVCIHIPSWSIHESRLVFFFLYWCVRRVLPCYIDVIWGRNIDVKVMDSIKVWATCSCSLFLPSNQSWMYQYPVTMIASISIDINNLVSQKVSSSWGVLLAAWLSDVWDHVFCLCQDTETWQKLFFKRCIISCHR